jgi:hypothetical protein
MLSIRNSQNALAKVVAGLAIAVTLMLGAIAHSVVASQPLV